jgi:hypothetical protein
MSFDGLPRASWKPNKKIESKHTTLQATKNRQGERGNASKEASAVRPSHSRILPNLLTCVGSEGDSCS